MKKALIFTTFAVGSDAIKFLGEQTMLVTTGTDTVTTYDPASVTTDSATVTPDPAAATTDSATVTPDPAAVTTDSATVTPDPAAATTGSATVTPDPADVHEQHEQLPYEVHPDGATYTDVKDEGAFKTYWDAQCTAITDTVAAQKCKDDEAHVWGCVQDKAGDFNKLMECVPHHHDDHHHDAESGPKVTQEEFTADIAGKNETEFKTLCNKKCTEEAHNPHCPDFCENLWGCVAPEPVDGAEVKVPDNGFDKFQDCMQAGMMENHHDDKEHGGNDGNDDGSDGTKSQFVQRDDPEAHYTESDDFKPDRQAWGELADKPKEDFQTYWNAECDKLTDSNEKSKCRDSGEVDRVWECVKKAKTEGDKTKDVIDATKDPKECAKPAE